MGYAEAMTSIFENYEAIPLTENYLKQFHKILLKFSETDQKHRGEYKKFPNHVEAFDPQGKSLGIIFETTSPFNTPREMSELMESLKKALENDTHHILLMTGAFIVSFLAIHPFQDGNGRLSRIYTTLLLLKHGYLYVRYSSLERIVEENKNQYYLSLQQTQQTLKRNRSNIELWILFFLKSLKKQKDILKKKLDQESLLLDISELSAEILAITKEHGRMTIGELEKLTKANRNTLKAHLRKLSEKNFLKAHGTGKGTWYTLCRAESNHHI